MVFEAHSSTDHEKQNWKKKWLDQNKQVNLQAPNSNEIEVPKNFDQFELWIGSHLVTRSKHLQIFEHIETVLLVISQYSFVFETRAFWNLKMALNWSY